MGTIRLDNAITLARPAGLAPQSIAHDYNNAYLQSWNFNVQRELFRNFALTVGYFGSKGTHLISRRNLNQPINGVPSISDTFAVEPHTSRYDSRQHHTSRERWQFQLQRSLD